MAHKLLLSPSYLQPAAFEAANKERRLNYCQPEDINNLYLTEQALKTIQMPKPFSL
jgi:hypothetical protein